MPPDGEIRSWLGLQEIQGLLAAAEDVAGLGGEPMLKDAGVDATEVAAELQVAAMKVGEIGVFLVETGADLGSEKEHGGGLSVVGTAAGVFLDASSELGEGHDEDAVEQFVLVEFVDEVVHGVAELGQERAVARELAGVGVEAAHGDVINARREAGGDHFRNEPEGAFELSAATARTAATGVDVSAGGTDVRSADLSIECGALEELAELALHSGKVAVDVVEFLEDRIGAGVVSAVAPREGVGVAECEGEELFALHGEGRFLGECDALDRLGRGVVALAAGVEVASDPAGLAALIGVGGVPDVHADEVAAVGVGIADAVNDGHASVVEELLESFGGGVKTEGIVEFEDVLPGDRELAAVSVVGVHLVGNYGVQAVISAGELDDDENALVEVFWGVRVVAGERAGGVAEERGDGCGTAEKGKALGEELAARGEESLAHGVRLRLEATLVRRRSAWRATLIQLVLRGAGEEVKQRSKAWRGGARVRVERAVAVADEIRDQLLALDGGKLDREVAADEEIDDFLGGGK